MAQAGKVWLMEWDELERGMGRRPDGCSLHASEQACSEFVAKYWASMPMSVPDEYEAPARDKPKMVLCDEALQALVEASGSVRLWLRSIKLDAGGASIVEMEPELLARAQAASLEKACAAGKPAARSLGF